MNLKLLFVAVAMRTAISGCATSSSKVIGSAAAEPAWDGPVFVSPNALPDGIEFKEIGTVQADASVGIDNVASLYPLLAAEAKKIGANAVFNAKGGHRVS